MSGVRWALVPFSLLVAGITTAQLYSNVDLLTRHILDAFFSATFFAILTYIILYALTNRLYSQSKKIEPREREKTISGKKSKK